MTRIATWSGIGVAGLAAFIVALGFGYGYGPQLGSAPVPLFLSASLVLIALLGLFTSPDDGLSAIDIRPFCAVTVGVLLFILTVDWLGMVPASLLTMGASYLGQTDRAYVGFATYAVLFTAGLWLVFTVGLGMPVPAFGGR